MAALDFPASPSVGQSYGSWQWDGSKWVSGSGGIPDAPNDSATYGRHALGWVSVLPTVGGNLTGTLNMASHSIIQLANPVLGTDAATKSYVDGKFAAAGTGSVTSITAGTGLNGGTITVSGTISLANTAVTAGSYTNTNLTVDAQGRITAAATGPAYAPIASPALTGTPTAPTAAPGTNSTQIATTAFVAPAYNDVGRNLVHNPLFNIQQRGAGPFSTNSAYTADRWLMSFTLDTMSINRPSLSDADRAQIGDETALVCLQNTFTGNAGASACNFMEHRIENIRRLSGKTVTVSFWSNANATLKLGINIIQVFGTGGSPSAPVVAQATGSSITTTSSWGRYSATIAIPSTAGKTFGTNGDEYTVLRLYYSSGANTNAQAGNIGVQSGLVNIWGVQLEVGAVATPLEKPDPQQDLAKCQRFYQTGTFQLAGYATAGIGAYISILLPVVMRTTPTLTTNTLTTTNVTGQALNQLNNYGISPYAAATATGGFVWSGNFTASADL